jgi:inosine-uridine nucleoside N-ribohydrolase
MARKRIPVILDTDIGGDIDDTWALGFMLRCPELDVRMVLSGTEDTRYKAKIVAKYLESVGRADVPVGVGVPTPCEPVHKTQAAWVEDYRLEGYSGTVHEDGVAALIDTIMKSQETITLIGIGPLPNIHEALKREPRIAAKCRFVGMHGSIRLGHDGRPGAVAEYNVVRDVPGAKAVFTADWKSVVITPLDSCGYVVLYGPKYQKVRASKDPIAATIIQNYRIWRNSGGIFETRSSILYDTVAVYLAFADALLTMETLPVVITDDGFTRVDAKRGKRMRVATGWIDLPAFEDLLVARLTAAQ